MIKQGSLLPSTILATAVTLSVTWFVVAFLWTQSNRTEESSLAKNKAYSCWEDVSKRQTFRNETALKEIRRYQTQANLEFAFYDCNQDGKLDRVSWGMYRITLVKQGESVPLDYYLSPEGYRIYYTNSVPTPDALVFKHISILSSEAQEYIAQFEREKNNPGSRGQSAFPPPDIWE